MKKIFILISIFSFFGCLDNDSIFSKNQEWYQTYRNYSDNYEYLGLKTETIIKNDSVFAEYPFFLTSDSTLIITNISSKVDTLEYKYKLIEINNEVFLAFGRLGYSGYDYLLKNKKQSKFKNFEIKKLINFQVKEYALGDSVNFNNLTDVDFSNDGGPYTAKLKNNEFVEFEIYDTFISSIEQKDIPEKDIKNIINVVSNKFGFKPDTIVEDKFIYESGYKWDDGFFTLKLTKQNLVKYYESVIEEYKNDNPSSYMISFYEKKLFSAKYDDDKWSLSIKSSIIDSYIPFKVKKEYKSIYIE